MPADGADGAARRSRGLIWARGWVPHRSSTPPPRVPSHPHQRRHRTDTTRDEATPEGRPSSIHRAPPVVAKTLYLQEDSSQADGSRPHPASPIGAMRPSQWRPPTESLLGKGTPWAIGAAHQPAASPARRGWLYPGHDPAKPPPPAFASGRIPPREGRFRGPCPRPCLGHGQQRLLVANSLRAVPPHVALGSPPTQHGSKSSQPRVPTRKSRSVSRGRSFARAYLVHGPMHCSTRPV